MATKARSHRLRSYERRGGIELLLAEDVSNLGDQGDIVRVKPGYARNYLVPQGLATWRPKKTRRRSPPTVRLRAKLRAAKVKQIQKLAKEVSNYSATIEANANEEGHLYGSVAGRRHQQVSQAGGYDISADQVRIEGPLKELGMYTVKLQLHPEVESEVKVWVVPVASKG